MRAVMEREEETDSEITLNSTTLLGIFFGLVLVCGVFFGFGYSIGRRGTTASPAAPTETSAATSAAVHNDKPAATESLQTASDTADKADTNTVTEPVDTNASSSTATATPAPPAKRPALVPAVAAKPSPSMAPVAVAAAKPAPAPQPPAAHPAVASAPAAAAPSGSIMVQIAAVTHQEDANVLVAALRKRGYSVAVRNEPQDKLLHVQVGPFSTRDEAKAMRAKLQTDGYNAILKP